jgi:DICT domain-containing protein
MLWVDLVVSVRPATAAISSATTVAPATSAAAIATSATATTTAVSTTAAATTWTVVLGASFVARDSTSGDFLGIQTIDCGLRFIGIWHFDESEPSRTTGLPIRNDTNLRDLAKTTESLANLVLRSAERQVTYINIRH